MKKVILCAGALMIGAVAFAQSGSPVMSGKALQGNGFGQSTPDAIGGVEADQAAPAAGALGTANRAETDQLGNKNKVWVAQAGTNQSAKVSQDNGSTGIGGNDALIVQTGEVTSDSGEDNAASIIQKGDRNDARVAQQGDNNSTYAVQGGSDDASSRNSLVVQQGTGQQAQNNAVEAYQDGTRNFGTIQQTYDRSSAYLDQDGERNKSSINQNAGPNGSAGHRAVNVQDGMRNQSIIDQTSDAPGSNPDSGRNVAEAFQKGDNNKSLQMQTTIANQTNPDTAGELALINQGDSSQTMGDRLDNTSLDDDLATLDGTGYTPDADGSFGGVAIQEQTGKMNAAEIHQYGSAASSSNEARQNQSGWNQDAIIIQNTNGNADGGGNYAFQDQSVDNNEAAIGQNGFDHKAAQWQEGRHNTALSAQRGNMNKVNTFQDGNNNKLTTNQNGMMNRTLIVQEDGQSAVVRQNVGEFGTTGQNQANIFQTGPGGTLPTDFMGDAECNFGELGDPGTVTPGGFDLGTVCPGCDD